MMTVSLTQYLASTATFFALLAAFWVGRSVLLARLRRLAEKTSSDVDDFAVGLLGKVRAFEAGLAALFIATRPLDLPVWLDRGLRGLVLIILAYRAITIIQGAAGFAIKRAFLKEPAGVTERNAARNISYLASFLIWLGGALFVLSNLGINITSFVAGLGIGGVAVALAAQAILGDLFSALAIYLDKPFAVGDFIIVDGFQGTVETIGVKTTRVRSLSGELLVFPNASLTSSRIRNFKQMSERRVALRFQAAFGTPLDKLRAVPETIKSVIVSRNKVRFDRVHLCGLGESSIDFEAVYYVLDADYAAHMDVQQEIILGVLSEFDKMGVSIPFPTRTLVHQGALPS